jgi:hypothetical protein
MLDIIMFGGVPIRVAMPPRIVAKDKGISVFLGGQLDALALFISMGIKSASAATLFMKAERIAPIKPIIDICPHRFFPNADIFWPIKKIAPELIKPFDTTNTNATIIVAG